ncbi:MAG: hypothetical protein ACXWTS_02085 [Methylococcaceae bacterium]
MRSTVLRQPKKNQMIYADATLKNLLNHFDLPHLNKYKLIKIVFASRFILESIGIVVETTEETWLDAMLEKFKGGFPTTREFSVYARSTLKDVNPQDGRMMC